MTPTLSNYWTMKSSFRLTYTLRILYVTQTHMPVLISPCSYELEKLASSIRRILGHALYILHVTRTHMSRVHT
jgi:hypothetical protein